MRKIIIAVSLMLFLCGKSHSVSVFDYTGWTSSGTVSTTTVYDAIISSGIGKGIILHSALFYPQIGGCYIELFDSSLSSDTSEMSTNSKRVWYSTNPYQPIWDINMSSGIVWNKIGTCAAEVLFYNPRQ